MCVGGDRFTGGQNETLMLAPNKPASNTTVVEQWDYTTDFTSCTQDDKKSAYYILW